MIYGVLVLVNTNANKYGSRAQSSQAEYICYSSL